MDRFTVAITICEMEQNYLNFVIRKKKKEIKVRSEGKNPRFIADNDVDSLTHPMILRSHHNGVSSCSKSVGSPGGNTTLGPRIPNSTSTV